MVCSTWLTHARDSVDTVMNGADRTGPQPLSEMPHRSYQHVTGFLKTGESVLFLEVSEVLLGSYRAARSIILEAETNLTLTSLLKGERDRRGERWGCQVSFSCPRIAVLTDPQARISPRVRSAHINSKRALSRKPKSHPHLASNPRIFIVEIKSWIIPVLRGAFNKREESQRWDKKYGSCVKQGQMSLQWRDTVKIFYLPMLLLFKLWSSMFLEVTDL